jgi:ring-1,2-phenylacetyl-CoA epoxidase subunit PaaE
MFFEELELLKKTYPDRFTLIHILENTDGDNKGILSQELLSSVLADSFKSFHHYYLCGPNQVMNNAEAVLQAHNIESSCIHREYFTAPISQTNEQDISIEPTDFTIHVKLYGKEYDIEVESQESILEAGIKNNIDPPYACQIAACCTCRAKLRSGKVHMESREALTDDEIEEGYILTCQAHPLTSDVFVDYDG